VATTTIDPVSTTVSLDGTVDATEETVALRDQTR